MSKGRVSFASRLSPSNNSERNHNGRTVLRDYEKEISATLKQTIRGIRKRPSKDSGLKSVIETLATVLLESWRLQIFQSTKFYAVIGQTPDGKWKDLDGK